jgi:hypothetical protein
VLVVGRSLPIERAKNTKSNLVDCSFKILRILLWLLKIASLVCLIIFVVLLEFAVFISQWSNRHTIKMWTAVISFETSWKSSWMAREVPNLSRDVEANHGNDRQVGLLTLTAHIHLHLFYCKHFIVLLIECKSTLSLQPQRFVTHSNINYSCRVRA